ncbi:extracellular solute-binding protein [Halalkalibacter sp. APA_J-10(15)]|uniref:extracellular solute-binding protein n=1 Tax=unclassified Halalkalibacter TaxID=2893063 RepID=UPI001FF4B428|nr:extracellular solute-binding protein [Halalkalibacter sp. APA_J-10(15)]MCK0469965.1 extracellular solute-binding protein [Halalkalibacter sp. APA_J-10(15)]
MKSKVFFKPFLLLLLMFTVLVFVACSNGEDENGSDEPREPSDEGAAESGEPLEISMGLNFDGTEAPESGNEVERLIEEYTNTQLDITHMVSANFCERLPVLIASGDLPDVIPSCGPPNQPYLLSAMQDGVFWEIGQYLDQFPNLASMTDIVYNNVEVNGELYGIPRYRPLSRFVTVYRKDWLDNLGIDEPTNMDEFYAALEAVSNNDPNNSGSDDTRGYTSVALPGDFGLDFGLAFGAPNNWDVDEAGNFIAEHETEEYLEGLKFSRQMYEDGVVNSDIVAPDRSTREADFENGITGFYGAATNNVVSIESRLLNNFPDAELGVYSALEGVDGERRLEGAMGSNGILMFPKSSVETEEHLLQLLGFFETLNDQEMVDLLGWGIEGTHYEMVDGQPQYIDYDVYMNDVGFPYRFPLVTAPIDDVMTQGQLSELEERVREIEVENDEFAVMDPAINLISDTRNELGADLDQLINDAKYRFVTGSIDEDGWWAEVDTWRSRGGDTIRAELEELYAERQ